MDKIDKKIMSGHMPDDSELKYMLEKSDIEQTPRNIGVLRQKLAVQMVDMMEHLIHDTTKVDEVKATLKKEAEKEKIVEEVPHQFDEIKLLVHKLEKQMTESVDTNGEQTPRAPEKTSDEPDARATALKMINQLVAIIASLNTGNQLTEEDKKMLSMGTNSHSEVTSVRSLAPTPEAVPPPTPAKADMPEMKKLEGEISNLKEEIQKLSNMPMPVKAVASYTTIDKVFDGASSEDAKAKLEKAEKRADEIHSLLTLPHDAILEKEAGQLASEIMRLRRNVNGQE